jgi:hypothetical protein
MDTPELNDEPDKPFHSSSYAEAASGDAIGSASPQPFSERYQIDRQRSLVQRYRDSHVARMHGRTDGNVDVVKPFTGIASRSLASRRRITGSKKQPGQSSPTTPPRPAGSGFHEPPARPYNPYS